MRGWYPWTIYLLSHSFLQCCGSKPLLGMLGKCAAPELPQLQQFFSKSWMKCIVCKQRGLGSWEDPGDSEGMRALQERQPEQSQRKNEPRGVCDTAPAMCSDVTGPPCFSFISSSHSLLEFTWPRLKSRLYCFTSHVASGQEPICPYLSFLIYKAEITTVPSILNAQL
jgi:hypothetical protein